MPKTAKKQVTLDDAIKGMTNGNSSNYPPNSGTEQASAAPQDTPTKDLAIERRLVEQRRAAAINLCINLESHFKLYSYRIIEHEYFVQTIDEMVKEYSKLIK